MYCLDDLTHYPLAQGEDNIPNDSRCKETRKGWSAIPKPPGV